MAQILKYAVFSLDLSSFTIEMVSKEGSLNRARGYLQDIVEEHVKETGNDQYDMDVDKTWCSFDEIVYQIVCLDM